MIRGALAIRSWLLHCNYSELILNRENYLVADPSPRVNVKEPANLYAHPCFNENCSQCGSVD